MTLSVFMRNMSPRRWVWAVVLLGLCALLMVTPAVAQEGGWTEAFEGSALNGWELGPDVAVADGALVIGPGNFAARLGEFQDFRFSFRVRFDDPDGAVSLIYHAREESEYALRFLPDQTLLERRSGGPLVPVAQTEGSSLIARSWNDVQIEAVSGGHRLSVNGEEVLSAQDDSPLRPGALVFINMGPVEIAIDDLSFEPQPVEGAVGEPPPEEMPGEPMPPEGQGEAIPPAMPTPTPTPAPGGLAGLLDQLAGGGARTDPLQLTTIVVNLVLAALFALVLGQAYIHWGLSLSNRRSLAANFLLITVTTTFIILVVRSSVALSLGLVGALSIVRFRAAIKEPEELAYLFFAIGLGIGLGDNQRVLTAATLIVGLILIGLVRLFRRAGSDMNLHLTVASQGTNPVQLDTLLETIKAHASGVRLLRFDENDRRLEASFLVEFRRLTDLQTARAALRELLPDLEITFLDNRGVV